MNIAHPAQFDKYQAIAAAIALLAELYPRCFSVYEGRRHPLKLGIHLDIQAALAGAITPLELHRALGAYCSNEVYLSYMRKGAWRETRAAAAKAQVPSPKRLSLADLKAAALARKTVSQEEITHAQNAATRCGKHRVGAKGQ